MPSESFETATLIDSTVILSNDVDFNLDPADFYLFNLSEASTVDVILTGLFDDADLALYDGNRNLIDSSANPEFDDEFIVADLPAGDYFLEVFAFSGFTDYTLDLLSLPTNNQPTSNDDTFETANLIDSTVIISGDVDLNLDISDFYTFNLSEESTVDVILTDLFDDADLALYDGDRSLIETSVNSGFDSEFIVADLPAGDYFLEVFAFSGFTDYTLDLLSLPTNNQPTLDDDTFDTANRIDSTAIISDDVDVSFDISDFYTFNLSEESTVDVLLTDLFDDADIALYDADRNFIQSSTNAVFDDESIVADLPAGDYFLEVYAFNGFTDYTLDVLTFPTNNRPIFDDGNNDFDNAQELGALPASLENERVSDSNDEFDYYKFNLANSSLVTLNLTGLSGGDADITLYDQNGDYIDSSSLFGSENENITISLSSGDYFIEVLAYEGQVEYDLSVSAQGQNTVPDDNAGNDFTSATIINLNSSLSDRVGTEDPEDYYRFDLSNSSEVTIELTGLFGDADIEIYDSSENVINASFNGGTSDESIIEQLGAGTYFIRVYPYADSFTEYNLNLVAEEQSTLPPSNDFSEQIGYGFLDASQAVATSINQPAFPEVASFGSDTEWPVNMVNAPEVWEQGFTGEGIIVAVLDTGVDRNHPDLFSNIWTNPGETPGDGIDNDQNGFIDDINGWNFATNKNNTLDANGHGTHVAGTIAGLNNGVGVTGVAYDAEIMPVKVLGDDGSGSFQGIANGIVYAVDNGANVINMSLGGGTPNATIREAMNYASSQGVIVVVAAGNEFDNDPGNAFQPANPAIFADQFGLAVGAVDRNNNITSFSNRAGNNSSLIYVTSPGQAINSSIPGGNYDSFNGTSMAAPHVAGIVALMLQANPNLTDNQVRNIVSSSISQSPTITALADQIGTATEKSSVDEIAISLEDNPEIPVNIPEVPGGNTPVLDDPLIRFQNSAVPGTFLFAGTEEAQSVRDNFSPPFVEEGPAFNVSLESQDGLVRFNRFQNSSQPGTFLFATEGESESIRANFPQFTEEGIAFYAFGAGAGQGTEYFRMQNSSVPGTFIFVNATERDQILANFPQFTLEGTAFEAVTS